jgi:hypothetical protein
MSNLSTQYNHFTRLSQATPVAPQLHAIESLQTQNTNGSPTETTPTPTSAQKKEEELEKVKSSTQKVLGSGLAGEGAKGVNSTVLNVEKVARLADGDVNAINIKAAIDLGEQVTRGRIQEALGTVATPLGAVVSAELMADRINTTVKDPNADNMKLLLKTGEGAARSFSGLSKFLVSNSDRLVSFAGKYSDNVGSLLAKGLGSKTAGVVKTGLTGSQRVLGHVGTALEVGVAGLDLYIAGRDIKTYWEDPTGKNMGKMGIGVVTAAASVLAAAKIPGISSKAAIVATLGDVAKISVDVDWATVYEGAKEKTTEMVSTQYSKLKEEVVGIPNPTIRRIQANAQSSTAIGSVSATLSQTRAIGY